MDSHHCRSKDFYIPSYILDPKAKADGASSSPPPLCPVLVFINPRSGGQRGRCLLETYRALLNEDQVYDLGEEPPEKVLHKVFANLERLRQSGDSIADHVINHLRLIVAGGDGTAGWLLSVVCDLKLTRPPPIATVPLGTGNNLPFSFGWGKKNPETDRESVEAFLEKVKSAKEMNIDNWHITMKMKAPREGSYDPIAPPLVLPHSLHKFRRLSSADSSNEEGYHTYRGGFWNYFSMGMDAQVSYAFHSARKENPENFKDQLSNQRMYAKLGIKQGWFFPGLLQDQSSNLSELAKVKVLKNPNDQWVDLKIPKSIRSIVCLNLPSFSGGLNPWGTPNKRKMRYRGFTRPYVDDGHIEIVGFKDAWHGLLLLAPKGHGTRLAQVHGIRFEFRKGVAKETYMRLDGEPWKQPLPEDIDDDSVVVDISHHGQVTMLTTGKIMSRSLKDKPLQSSHYRSDDSDENSEERRKFGAANTFKMHDDVYKYHSS